MLRSTTSTFQLHPLAGCLAAAMLLTACGDDVVSGSGIDSNGETESDTEATDGPIGASQTSTGSMSDSDSQGSDTTGPTTSGPGGATDDGSSSSSDTDRGSSSSSDTDRETDSASDTDSSTDTDSDTDTDGESESSSSTGGDSEPAVGCGDGEITAFAENFAFDNGLWDLDPKWAFADGGAWGGVAGDGVMASAWNVGGNGCPTTQRVVMNESMTLGSVATMRFAHSGELAQFDTLRVIASTDEGATWQEVAAYDDVTGPTAAESTVEVDVSPFAGGDVRFGFEYDNICGDPLGVTWVLDDVVVCEPDLCDDGQQVAMFEDFESDDGDWILGTHWTYADGVDFAQAGDGVMAGYWDTLGFAGGCPTTQRVELADPVELFGNATLAFSQAAQLSTNDTLRVLASSDDGVTWQTVAEYDDSAGLTPGVESIEMVNLAAIAAAGDVRIAFEFENICGDPLGVEWGIDDVLLCTDPIPSPCGTGQTTLFEEDFESDNGDWILGTHWTYDDGANFAQAGDGVMAGYWDTLGFAGGCPTTQRVEMANSVIPTAAVELRFSHAAQLATNDTLRILVSTDNGATWDTAQEYDDSSGLTLAAETAVAVDLSAWAGLGPLRVAFEFDNICGDALGVEWGIDDVLLCQPADGPN